MWPWLCRREAREITTALTTASRSEQLELLLSTLPFWANRTGCHSYSRERITPHMGERILHDIAHICTFTEHLQCVYVCSSAFSHVYRHWHRYFAFICCVPHTLAHCFTYVRDYWILH